MPRLRERALAERRRDVGALDLLEAHRQRTGLEDQREVLRLLDRAALAEVDLGVRAGDAVGVALEVDVRRRLELAVEHDREVLRRSSGSRPGCRRASKRSLPRSASSRVIFWNWSEPWFVNCRSTIGPPVCPKSARVPESTRSPPVISGIGVCFPAAFG